MLSFACSPPILASVSTYMLVAESYRSARVVRAQGSTDPLGTRFLETCWSYLRSCGVVSVRKSCEGSRLHGPSRNEVPRDSLELLEGSVLSSPYQPSNQLAKTPVFALLVMLKGPGGCIVLLLLDRVTKQRHSGSQCCS
jgi:hypothetical protein